MNDIEKEQSQKILESLQNFSHKCCGMASKLFEIRVAGVKGVKKLIFNFHCSNCFTVKSRLFEPEKVS